MDGFKDYTNSAKGIAEGANLASQDDSASSGINSDVKGLASMITSILSMIGAL